MKLINAASPSMRAAHAHTYVLSIVDILMQERNLLRPTSQILKKYHSSEQQGFKRDLDALCLNQSRPNVAGEVVSPEIVIRLTQILNKLYQQNEQQISYHRGAIVEALVRRLICHRYGVGEFCLNNQRFVDDHGKEITVTEVDVAALSTIRSKVEGYECKINSYGFDSYDSINLKDLVDAAHDRDYLVNVGFISLDADTLMKIKLQSRQLPEEIRLYGLDSIEALENFLF